MANGNKTGNGITISDKQYLAKVLYTREQLDGKVVAKRVGVSEKTISKWVNDFNWKELRQRLLLAKDELLGQLYRQLEALNGAIEKSEAKHPTTAQADTQVKLTAAIRNLETDLAIADKVQCGIDYIKHIQRTGTFEQVTETLELWNSFIQASVKK